MPVFKILLSLNTRHAAKGYTDSCDALYLQLQRRFQTRLRFAGKDVGRLAEMAFGKKLVVFDAPVLENLHAFCILCLGKQYCNHNLAYVNGERTECCINANRKAIRQSTPRLKGNKAYYPQKFTDFIWK